MKKHLHTPDHTLWSQHLAPSAADGGDAPWQPLLSPAEAARVQRHRDRLMAALHARDRAALHCAKQGVLTDVYGPATRQGTTPATPSTALRSALRDLSWRMASLVLTRSAHH